MESDELRLSRAVIIEDLARRKMSDESRAMEAAIAALIAATGQPVTDLEIVIQTNVTDLTTRVRVEPRNF